MTRIFDGMASILNGVFGGTVFVTPNGGSQREIRGAIREKPVRILDAEGVEIETIEITLRALQADVSDLRRGDLIEAESGKQYRYMSRHPSGSPASDASAIIQLEEA